MRRLVLAALLAACEPQPTPTPDVQSLAQPVFAVLQTHLSRSKLGRSWHRSINDHHRGIAAAIESGDERGAEEQMHDHLVWLRPYYEKAWRAAGRTTVGA